MNIIRLLKISLSVFATLFTLSISALGQNEKIWTFGNHAGLNFSGTMTGILTEIGGLSGTIGCATQCDANGDLLFYSDGLNIYDKNGTIMPSGDTIGDNTFIIGSQQGVVTIPFPNNANKFYVFCTSRLSGVIGGQFSTVGAAYLYYSVVDMTLNGGLGDVVAGSKKIILDSLLNEAIIAMKGDNDNYWLAVHKKNTQQFRSYEINDCGILNTTPVISNVSSINYWSFERLYMSYGRINKKLAVTTHVGYWGFPPIRRVLELYDFNTTSGMLSNAMLLDSIQQFEARHTCFSPNNDKLYVSAVQINTPNPYRYELHQYDVTLPNAIAIAASRVLIDTIPTSFGSPITAMKIDPTGTKILTGINAFSSVGQIANPNATGTACNFQINITPLYTNTTLGIYTQVLNNFPNEMFPPGAATSNINVHSVQGCSGSPAILNAPSGFATFTWNNGSHANSLSASAAGTYWVISEAGCATRTDTFHVTITDVSVSLGADTMMCPGDVIRLSATIPGYTYVWHNGSTDSVYNVTSPGTYWVTVTNGSCSASDTIVINSIATSFSIGNDTTLCPEEPLMLNAYKPGYHYLWHDGSTNATNTVTGPGTYWVTISNGNCTASDTLTALQEEPFIFIGNDTSLCAEEELVLDGFTANYKYQWHDGTSAANTIVTGPGTYWLTISKMGCEASDTINIKRSEIKVSLGEDKLLCRGEILTLQPRSGDYKYTWQDHSDKPVYQVSTSGTYWIKISRKGCEATDTVTVNFQKCQCQCWIPNVFTPNGDGTNDRIAPIFESDCNISNYTFSIYNRFGERVFKTNNVLDKWDGRYKGEFSDIGTYMYQLEYSNPNGSEKYLKGDISLLR